jgi:hypothetical protein
MDVGPEQVAQIGLHSQCDQTEARRSKVVILLEQH